MREQNNHSVINGKWLHCNNYFCKICHAKYLLTKRREKE